MHEKYMKIALNLAKQADKLGEIPVGCIIVHDGKIIARAKNTRESKKNALHHAEILAIDKACKKISAWRLEKCTLYVTLEPCAMCAGAIINSRIDMVVFGANDLRFGACGSLVDLFSMEFNHKPKVISGIFKKECTDIIKNFFKVRRNLNKIAK